MRLQERCVCGGLIVAGAPWDVMDAVGRHNATDRHTGWRRHRAHVESNRQYRARLRDCVVARRLARELAAEWTA